MTRERTRPADSGEGLRILFLTHRLPYAPNRGDRIRAYHMVRQLARRHHVDLVSLVHDTEEAERAESLRPLVDSVVTARAHRNRNAVRGIVPFLRGRTLTHVLLDAPDLRTRIEEVVRRHRPDVVLAYCSGMARFALEPPLDRIPFVLDMVDVDSEKWAALGQAGRTPKHSIYRREASLLRNFEHVAACAAHTTLVVNEREAESLGAIAPSARIAVVPNGIELDDFRSPLPPNAEPGVVLCGVMNYEPNEAAARWFVRSVWPLVRAARPDATFTIVGANPTAAVRDLAGPDRSVRVTGSVADVKPFLWQAAVSVAPLFVARGLQNKVLEAVAAGLPSVVTSAVHQGLPPEVMAACTVADTPDVFAAKVLQLLSRSAGERRAMTERADMETLTWARRLATLESILLAAARSSRACATSTRELLAG